MNVRDVNLLRSAPSDVNGSDQAECHGLIRDRAKWRKKIGFAKTSSSENALSRSLAQ